MRPVKLQCNTDSYTAIFADWSSEYGYDIPICWDKDRIVRNFSMIELGNRETAGASTTNATQCILSPNPGSAL